MKELINLNDLMQEQLRAMYDSERQIASSLPKILNKVSNPQLKEVISSYCEQHDNQVWRLRQVFDLLFLQKRGEKSVVMKIMLKDMKELVKRGLDKEVKDAIIITSLQHIIHYQIAGYGAICNYANTLQLYEVASRMHLNLEEEKSIDRKLAIIAEQTVNLKATQINQ